MTVATNNHVMLDENGVARIDGTRMKVVHLVSAMTAHQLSPDRLLQEFPHLTLAQIHAALSHYYDHRAQFDAEIQRDADEFDRERAKASPSPIREKLRASGVRP